mmetsp:Transcript_1014/g.1581  ORF Transcript_1014/g.1581 Transcript_1014/m.1581 type:complete len:370 (+) Transcript_1014:64-1173(+)
MYRSSSLKKVAPDPFSGKDHATQRFMKQFKKIINYKNKKIEPTNSTKSANDRRYRFQHYKDEEAPQDSGKRGAKKTRKPFYQDLRKEYNNKKKEKEEGLNDSQDEDEQIDPSYMIKWKRVYMSMDEDVWVEYHSSKVENRCEFRMTLQSEEMTPFQLYEILRNNEFCLSTSKYFSITRPLGDIESPGNIENKLFYYATKPLLNYKGRDFVVRRSSGIYDQQQKEWIKYTKEDATKINKALLKNTTQYNERRLINREYYIVRSSTIDGSKAIPPSSTYIRGHVDFEGYLIKPYGAAGSQIQYLAITDLKLDTTFEQSLIQWACCQWFPWVSDSFLGKAKREYVQFLKMKREEILMEDKWRRYSRRKQTKE